MWLDYDQYGSFDIKEVLAKKQEVTKQE